MSGRQSRQGTSPKIGSTEQETADTKGTMGAKQAAKKCPNIDQGRNHWWLEYHRPGMAATKTRMAIKLRTQGEETTSTTYLLMDV